ncbi:MAG: hypothetical protein M9894_09815 [Planctomycetes bacterium]|nr:hypothetical protein [Planctomycetota bacterium]
MGALLLIGGRAGVAALFEPGPRLDAGRLELDVARANLPPVDDEPLVPFSVQLLRARPAAHLRNP